MPISRRQSANHSYSSAGSSDSTTTVIGKPVADIHAPPQSQAPRWGMAMIAPRPAARARSALPMPS